ncbi:MAG: DUF3618 domain-containing protein [Steroidobacter sp.]
MNASTENRDPAELEREASEIRADMDRTLDALERKFSPGQLLDRSLSYMRDHGGGLTRNVGDTVKQNPIPVLMTAAGLAWLITSSITSRSKSGGMYSSDYDEYAEPGLRDKLGAKLQEGRDTLGEKLHEGADAAKRTWRSSTTAASGRTSQAMNAARARAQRAQQRAHDLVDEQPLVLGALALAAGALIGAALPTTQYENRTVGPVRDRTLDKAKEAGGRQYQNLRSKLEPHEDVQVSGRTN